MVRIPHLVVAAVATVSLGLGTACDKKGGGAGGSAASGGDLTLLPVNSDIVLGLNMAQLQKSLIWKKFVEPKMNQGDAAKDLAEFKTRCGFDPVAAVTTLSLGLKFVPSGDPDGVAVIHGLDKAKSIACFDKYKADMEKEGVTASVTDGVYVVKNKQEKNVAMTFIDDGTVLVVFGTNANAAGVKAAATGTSTLKSSKEFTDMYGKVNANDSFWAVANGNAPFFDQMGAMAGAKPKAMFGSVNVTDGLTLDLHVRLDSADQASSLATMAKGQTGQVAQYFDKIDVGNDGADLKVNLGLSNAKLETLMQKAGPMLGLGQ